MTDYDNTNSGALFKNKEKQTDKHPDYRGSLDVEGEEFWVSAWLKTSKKGEKYMSLAIKLKEEQAAPEPPQRSQTKHNPPDDDLPF